MGETNHISELLRASVTQENWLGTGGFHSVFKLNGDEYDDVVLRVSKDYLEKHEGAKTTHSAMIRPPYEWAYNAPKSSLAEALASSSSLTPVAVVASTQRHGQTLFQLHSSDGQALPISIMQKVPGKSIAWHWQTQRLNADSPDKAVESFIEWLGPQLETIYREIHTLCRSYSGMVDANPGNIMLDDKGDARLVDYEFANTLGMYADKTPMRHTEITAKDFIHQVSAMLTFHAPNADLSKLKEASSSALTKLSQENSNAERVALSTVKSVEAIALSQPSHALRQAIDRVQQQIAGHVHG